MKQMNALLLMAGIIVACNSCKQSSTAVTDQFNVESEMEEVDRVIHNAICWAMTKDTIALYSTFVPDSTLFIFSPDSASTLTGFQAIRDLAENFWMTERFKALECNIRDLRIRFSQGGDAAWYSCYLDDISEVDGRLSGWRNIRWTGVLEKRQGRWLIMQMHFSYPLERFR